MNIYLLYILVNKCPFPGGRTGLTVKRFQKKSKRFLKGHLGARHGFISVLVTGPKMVSWRNTISKHVDWKMFVLKTLNSYIIFEMFPI